MALSETEIFSALRASCRPVQGMLLVAVESLACSARGDWSSSDKLGALASQYARNRFFAPLKPPIFIERESE